MCLRLTPIFLERLAIAEADVFDELITCRVTPEGMEDGGTLCDVPAGTLRCTWEKLARITSSNTRVHLVLSNVMRSRLSTASNSSTLQISTPSLLVAPNLGSIPSWLVCCCCFHCVQLVLVQVGGSPCQRQLSRELVFRECWVPCTSQTSFHEQCNCTWTNL